MFMSPDILGVVEEDQITSPSLVIDAKPQYYDFLPASVGVPRKQYSEYGVTGDRE